MSTPREPRHGAKAAQTERPATGPTPPPAPAISGMTPVRLLGSGGFSHVYLYEQDFPRRVTAVKVLTGDFSNPEARTDFADEVDAMGRLSSHPAIVSVWAAGVATTGAPYLALEYCPGSLRERTRTQPATIAEVLDAGVRLAGALESAHLAGVLHRDVKPSNVLLTATGRPALSDFGISLRGFATGTPDTPSAAKLRALSVPWAAPEIVTRQSNGTVASEVWALGATLYTFATSRSPFEEVNREHNTPEQLVRRIAQGRYLPIETSFNAAAPAVDALNAVLSRAMQVLPQRRFSSMREFGTELQRIQAQLGYPVTPIDILETGWAGSLHGTPRTGGDPLAARAAQQNASFTQPKSHTAAWGLRIAAVAAGLAGASLFTIWLGQTLRWW